MPILLGRALRLPRRDPEVDETKRSLSSTHEPSPSSISSSLLSLITTTSVPRARFPSAMSTES